MDVRDRFAGLLAGLRCLPDRRGWLKVALELGWSLPLMLVVAHLGGLVHVDPAGDASTLLRLGATLLIAPALGEELLFRGLLIPRRAASAKWMLLSVLLFVLWHPLQAVTIGSPWAATLLDPWFLAMVAILGTALGRIYAATGSLWPGIALHWAVVFGWKAVLGGPF
jgi:uncharacterized protein